MENCLRLLALTMLLGTVAISPAQQASGSRPSADKNEHDASHKAATPASPPIPAYHRSEKEAKPFPALLPASQFAKYPVVARAYEIAREIPGVLAQQPCYCYCDRNLGHTSLLDCYTSTHTAGCWTCLKETYFAYRMTKRGMKPAAIRAAIIRGEWRETRLN